jgi:Domain of unknown function (DUF4352)
MTLKGFAVAGLLALVLGCAHEADSSLDDIRRESPPSTTTTTRPSTTTTSEPPITTTAPPSTTVETGDVGEPVSASGWTLIVHDVTDPYGPAALPNGDRSIAVDLEISRDDGGPATISSFDNFELAVGAERSPGIDIQTLPSVGGSIAPGDTRRGTLGFIVPADITTGLVLQFRPRPFDDPVVAVRIA